MRPSFPVTAPRLGPTALRPDAHRCLRTMVLAGAAALLPSGLLVAGDAARYLRKPDDWYRGEEAIRIADNILSHQSPLGGWPKNIDTTAAPYEGDRGRIRPTFDNGATVDELRLLARAHRATAQPRYKEAFRKGLDYILGAQYPTGGWPQSHPPGTGYPRHITFNDGAVVRVLELLREVAAEERYDLAGEERRKAARTAFDRGIECILRCQIRIDGKRTAWCAQHDEVDYRPRPARSYELVSISGAESVGIVRLLMSLEEPSEGTIEAVEGAVEWFRAARLFGIKVVRTETPEGSDREVVEDPEAPPMWARFYEIETNRPIFCDRDGVAKRRLSDIGRERRNGYSWLGYWPQALLAEEYPAWKGKRAP